MVALLAAPVAPLSAKTRKGDKYLAEGRGLEAKKDWDGALENYQKALSEDPSEVIYQMSAEKARFQAGQAHLDKGLQIRDKGLLGDALLEFQKAYSLNPSSSAAAQEIAITQQMIDRERKRVEQTGKEAPPEERALTPVEVMRQKEDEKIDRMLPVPELRPLNTRRIDLTMRNQPPRVLFETVAKYAGINVIWDPDYQAGRNESLELNNSTLDQALDYIAVMTKSFWKPLSPNTIFITNDNPNKRRDYEDQVMRVFYLNNVQTPQELQEIVNAVRSVADIQRLFPYNSQNAIIARGEADRIALAGKIIHDLDKPKAEVVIDVLVLSASQNFSRQITAALASTGLNVPVVFSPRPSLQVPTNPNISGTTTPGTVPTTTTPSGTTGIVNPTTGLGTGLTSGLTGTASQGPSPIPLSNLAHLSSSDFAITLPGALLQAALSDANTKILQAPQIRSVDNQKASLKIGDREPTATGSFQPGIGGVGINPLVNTQFTYIDVGVNVDITPRVHENGEVSMHVEIDISSVNGTVNLGGIDQPIIGQNKIVHDVRMREGEVNLLAGLVQQQDTKTVTGIPGLSSIPLLRRLFSGESVTRSNSQLMIALIPHIVRRPSLSPDDLRGISVGNATVVKLNYAPSPAEAQPPAPAPGAAATAQGAAPPAPPQTPATPPAPPVAPPTAAPAPGAPPAPPPAASAANIRFLPAQVDTTASNAVSVSLLVDGASGVASAPMQIQFDPRILRLNDVNVGGFFSQGGQQPVVTKNILNDAGTAVVQISLPPGTPGVSGAGVLATLNFQAVGRGSTSVTIPNLTLRNAQAQVVATASPQLTVNVK